MDTQNIVTIIGAITALIAAIGVATAAILSAISKSRTQLDEIHTVVNSAASAQVAKVTALESRIEDLIKQVADQKQVAAVLAKTT